MNGLRRIWEFFKESMLLKDEEEQEEEQEEVEE